MRGSPSRVVVGGRGSAVSLLELSNTLRGDRRLPQAGRWEFGHGVRKTSHREIKSSEKKGTEGFFGSWLFNHSAA